MVFQVIKICNVSILTLTFLVFFWLIEFFASYKRPTIIFHLILNFGNPLHRNLALLLPLFLLIPELFISDLGCVHLNISHVAHVFGYFLVSKLVIFVKFNRRIELFKVLRGPSIAILCLRRIQIFNF